MPLNAASSARAAYESTARPGQVDVLGHRRLAVTELVRDQASRQRGLVEDGRGRLPERVRRDPGQRLLAPGFAQLATHGGRISVAAAQDVREQRLVEASPGHEP